MSTYNPRQSRITTVQQLGVALDTRSAADLRKDVFDSNGGPLAVAAEHHAKTLEHCFVVSTAGDKGSELQFGTAQRLLKAFSNPEARFHQVVIPDANDLSRIVSEIARVYERVGGFNLRIHDVIADFTGGTSVMSGGVILVAAEKGIEIEYVRQDRSLTTKDGHPLTPREIFKHNVLVTIHAQGRRRRKNG